MTKPLSLRLFGHFEILWPEGIRIPTRKAEALLAYLALPAGQLHSRGQLANLLWGSRDERHARHSLNQALSSLKKALVPHAPGLLMVSDDAVSLASNMIETDVKRLNALIRDGSAEALSQLSDLYRGDLLPGFDVKEEEFECWLSEERARLRERVLAGLQQLLDIQCADGPRSDAIGTARRLLRLDPLNEATHRRLIRLYAEDGQRNAALKQYRTCADILERDLGIAPDKETRVLHEKILRGLSETAQDLMVPVRPRPLLQPTELTAPPLAKPGPARPPVVMIGEIVAAGADEADQAVAAVLHEELLTVLSRERDLVVQDLVTPCHMGTIGQDKASLTGNALMFEQPYVIKGLIQTVDDEARLTLRLVDASVGLYLWSERCVEKLDRFLGKAEHTAQHFAAVFKREIEAAEARRADAKPDALRDAWSHYHLALREMYRFSMPGLEAACFHLQRAIVLNPDFAAAQARLAYVYVQMYWYGPHEKRERFLEKGVAAAKLSVGLDPKDAHGHFALGRLYAIKRQFDLAIPEFETAIMLDPSFAQASFGLGQAYSAAGQPKNAIVPLDRAIALDEYDPHLWTFYHDRAEAKFALGKLDEAEANSKAAVRLPNASHFALATLVSVLGARQKTDEAAHAVGELHRRKPEYTLAFAREDLEHHANRSFVGNYLDGLERAGLETVKPAASSPFVTPR